MAECVLAFETPASFLAGDIVTVLWFELFETGRHRDAKFVDRRRLGPLESDQSPPSTEPGRRERA